MIVPSTHVSMVAHVMTRWETTNVFACQVSLVRTVRKILMNVSQILVKMEPFAKIMSTPTPVSVPVDSLEEIVRRMIMTAQLLLV